MGRPWMDFAMLRDRASFATVLARYGIVPARLTGQVTVLCPFHDDRQPSLSIHMERKLFHCFACQAQGDILDFVARLEQVTLREAAGIVAVCCALPPEERMVKQGYRVTAVSTAGTDVPCRAIDLDPAHPYLRNRGLTPALIETFGLGYCNSGRLAGRIGIPLHSPDGSTLLGYAGRWAEDPVPDGVPRYLMPRGFRKNALLFNYLRVQAANHLVIVEGLFVDHDQLGIAPGFACPLRLVETVTLRGKTLPLYPWVPVRGVDTEDWEYVRNAAICDRQSLGKAVTLPD